MTPRAMKVLCCLAIAVLMPMAMGQSKAPGGKKAPPPPVAWIDAATGLPHVSAAGAIVMDADTGKVLWSKDADTPRYPASTTKIMTALLLIEKCKPTESIRAPDDVEKVKEASMHLKPGERVPAKDMLYALMLRSANDGCYAVACHIGGSVEGFAELMNQRAKAIGCTGTTFRNPNGLNDPDHKTTPRDLALIAREAMKRPEFRAVTRTQKQQISRSINHEDLWMINKNRLLKYDPTVDGIKTGYTSPAGKCFVGSAVRNGYRLITVVMKSEDWAVDTKVLLDWAFGAHEWRTYFRPGEIVAAPRIVRGGASDEVALGVEKTGKSLVPKGSASRVEFSLELPEEVVAPVRRGQRVGFLSFRDADGFAYRLPVVALVEVPARTPVQAAVGRLDPWTLGGAGGLFGLAYLMRRKARRTGAQVRGAGSTASVRYK
jgi:D-alanyl-D-alanine carboxypeptidase